MKQTLLQKVWDHHAVRTLPTGQTQLFIGLHLIHEVTSPQAFDMLRARGSKVAFPNRTFATVDHIVPTLNQRRPFLDVLAEEMMSALETELPRVRHSALRHRQRQPGHRPCHRTGARADAAGHDDRLRRQPHVHARRVRRDRVRHRHVAGARRARVAVPGDGAAEGAPHHRQRRRFAPACTRRT